MGIACAHLGPARKLVSPATRRNALAQHVHLTGVLAREDTANRTGVKFRVKTCSSENLSGLSSRGTFDDVIP